MKKEIEPQKVIKESAVDILSAVECFVKGKMNAQKQCALDKAHIERC